MPNLPWGFTNSTELTAGTVLKRYEGPDAASRRSAEFAFFTEFAGVLPVPRIVSTVDTPGQESICTELLPGRPGTDLIETGHAEWVFHAAGALLRRIGVAAAPSLPGSGPVIVHGDYGPQNLLLDADRKVLTAVLDAEWARQAPEELRHADAAWFEWIIRFHHPGLTHLLPVFYDGYGQSPPWPLRHQLMLRRCTEVLDFATRRDSETSVDSGTAGESGAARWRERVATTRAFRN